MHVFAFMLLWFIDMFMPYFKKNCVLHVLLPLSHENHVTFHWNVLCVAVSMLMSSLSFGFLFDAGVVLLTCFAYKVADSCRF